MASIETLEARHDELDQEVDRITGDPAQACSRVGDLAEMKKKKLRLKDQIAALKQAA